MIGIVSPMRLELVALLREVVVARQRSISGRRFHCGRIGSAAVVLTSTGQGPVHAAAGVASLLDGFPVTHLVFLGVAGALSPSLAPGDVLVAGEVRDRAAGSSLAPDPRLLASALTVDGITEGVLVTTRSIIGGSSQKEAARRELPQGRPAAVDLESLIFARSAAERRCPFIVLRSISDTAAENLPALILQSQVPGGGVDRHRVLRGAIRHPLSIPNLLRLRRRVAFCADRLAETVVQLVRMREAFSRDPIDRSHGFRNRE